MRTESFIAIVALPCTTLSCKKPTPTNIVARYTAQRPHGFESLELIRNGSYVQEFTVSAMVRKNIREWTVQLLIHTQKGALNFYGGCEHPTIPLIKNDCKMKSTYFFNPCRLEGLQNEPFSHVTPESQ